MMPADRAKDKVCFVCISVKPGGGNKVIFELCDIINRSSQLEYEIIAIDGTSSNNTSYSFSKFNNLQTRCLGFKSNHPILLFCNLILTFSYLVLFCHQYKAVIINSSLLAPIFGFIPSENIYSYIQADDYSLFDNRFSASIVNIYKWVTKNISYKFYQNRYIFNSQFTYEKFRAVGLRDLQTVNFMLPGVDLDIFKPSATLSTRTKLNISSILRKQPWKGSIDFVSAIANLPQEILDQVNFIGITNEDISNLNIPDLITITRPKSDGELAMLFQETDIFIVNSHWEGFGLPGLEAIASGCALISSDNGGCNEYTVDGVNCILYEPKNVSELTKKITFLLEQNHLQKQLSIEGLNAAKKHSWQTTFENLQEILGI
jgi:glycosyltransferase involved in cell wall biosynthesis